MTNSDKEGIGAILYANLLENNGVTPAQFEDLMQRLQQEPELQNVRPVVDEIMKTMTQKSYAVGIEAQSISDRPFQFVQKNVDDFTDGLGGRIGITFKNSGAFTLNRGKPIGHIPSRNAYMGIANIPETENGRVQVYILEPQK